MLATAIVSNLCLTFDFCITKCFTDSMLGKGIRWYLRMPSQNWVLYIHWPMKWPKDQGRCTKAGKEVSKPCTLSLEFVNSPIFSGITVKFVLTNFTDSEPLGVVTQLGRRTTITSLSLDIQSYSDNHIHPCTTYFLLKLISVDLCQLSSRSFPL